MNNNSIDKYLNNLISSEISSCFDIAVIKKDKLVYSFREGKSSSDSKNSQSITEDSCFNIGSVTKPITAALIVKLIEENEISLNTLVRDILPEYRFSDITIYNLLSHTAGYDPCDRHLVKWPLNIGEMDYYLKSIYELRPRHNPGKESLYATYGYTLLMEIIEKITKENIETYAQRELFIPLGMNKTTFDFRKCSEKYILPWNRNENRYLTEFKETPPVGDTGLLSNALDLVKFGQIFLSVNQTYCRNVFPFDCIRFMRNEYTNWCFNKTPVFWIKNERDIYGCFGELNSTKALCHTGFSGCMLLVDPELDFTMAIITNSTFLHEDWSNYKKICDEIISGLSLNEKL